MAGTPLEIAGAIKRTEKGNTSWYYGAGGTGYNSLLDAYNNIPSEVREGQYFGVWTTVGAELILVEYCWSVKNAVSNGDEVLTGGGTGTGNASIDDSYTGLDKTWSSQNIQNKLDTKVDKEEGKGLSEKDYTASDKLKVDGITRIFLGYYIDLASLQTAEPIATAGQFAIVGSNRYVWDVVTENYVLNSDSAGDTFISDFTVIGTTFGKYGNGQTVPAAGKTPAEVILLATVNTIPPSYSGPSSSLSINQNSNTLEVGQTVNVTVDPLFIKNDAGAITSISIKKDGVEIGNTDPYIDNNVLISTINKVYQAAINYDEGSVKNDNMGNPNPSGRIPAGQTVTNQAILRGYYRSFWGNVAAQPSTSSDVRALASNRLENGNSGGGFTLNTGSINSKFVIVLAPGRSLSAVTDQDALNLDITSEYELVNSNFTVNDAAGTPVTGFKMYIKTNSVPYTANHRHNISTG